VGRINPACDKLMANKIPTLPTPMRVEVHGGGWTPSLTVTALKSGFAVDAATGDEGAPDLTVVYDAEGGCGTRSRRGCGRHQAVEREPDAPSRAAMRIGRFGGGTLGAVEQRTLSSAGDTKPVRDVDAVRVQLDLAGRAWSWRGERLQGTRCAAGTLHEDCANRSFGGRQADPTRGGVATCSRVGLTEGTKWRGGRRPSSSCTRVTRSCTMISGDGRRRFCAAAGPNCHNGFLMRRRRCWWGCPADSGTSVGCDPRLPARRRYVSVRSHARLKRVGPGVDGGQAIDLAALGGSSIGEVEESMPAKTGADPRQRNDGSGRPRAHAALSAIPLQHAWPVRESDRVAFRIQDDC